MRSHGMWGRSSSRIIEKYQAIHIYCAASGATYEYALDIFAADKGKKEWLGYNRLFESNLRRTGDV